MVALGGDADTTVYRHRGNPITFPELPILMHIHGDTAITDVHVVGKTDDMAVEEMRTRLMILYGETAIKAVYPGTRPTFPASDPNIPLCRLKIFTPGPTKPDNPDPILRPLDQFTLPGAKPLPKREKLPEPYEVEAPNTPSLTAGGDDGPTVDEIASHEEDEIDAELGLSDMVAAQPRNFTTRDNHARGSRRDRAGLEDHLPDVAAGGSQNRARRHAEA